MTQPVKHIYVKGARALNELGKRKNNEDAIFPAKGQGNGKDASRTYIVCDGVGGLDKGEEASRIVVDMFGSRFGKQKQIHSGEIRDQVMHAEDVITDFVRDQQLSQEIATTLAMAHVADGYVTIAHVGDSRVYHFRKSELLFCTRDHSFVNEMVDQGVISKEEAHVHPKRNVVTRAISTNRNRHKPDVTKLSDVQDGDLLFLCSDGINEALNDTELCTTLADPAQTVADKMAAIEAVCQEKSNDNFSAYLIELGVEGAEAAASNAPGKSDSKKPWGMIAAAGAGAILLIVLLALSLSGSDDEPDTNVGSDVEMQQDSGSGEGASESKPAVSGEPAVSDSLREDKLKRDLERLHELEQYDLETEDEAPDSSTGQDSSSANQTP